MSVDGASPNSLRETWRLGHTAFGLWLAIPNSFTAEIAAQSGPDYVCIDQQHGLVDLGVLVSMLQAVRAEGVMPLTRVLSNEPSQIGQALDVGARGVIVPFVETAEEAERAVRACRYPPRGTRSYGPIRAATAIGSDRPEVLAEDALCIVMIETTKGLENLNEIVTIGGIDAIYIGPTDLALSLGVAPTLRVHEPSHVSAISEVLATCRRRKVRAGVHCDGGQFAHTRAAEGFDMVTIGTDSAFLGETLAHELHISRGDRPRTGAASQATSPP